GAWLDPIADKLLILLCFLALLRIGAVALWLVVLVIVRDAIIGLGALLTRFLSLSLKIAPLALGKAATAVQLVYVGVLLLLLAFDSQAPRLLAAGGYAVAMFALLSAAAYAQLFLKALPFGGRTA
ncbi:MAG: CDP-alcohol phosphatidyltransferase family protein, partial [Rhizomicrobium sp.]